MRLVLLGKPGSGKGTQAKRIARDEGVPQISTGDLIRASIATGSELGRSFRSYTEKGLLVPDAVVLEMVEERLVAPDCEHGFLLDGFPRTLPQAQRFDTWLKRQGSGLDVVVRLVVEDQILVDRIVGRRFCPADGESYHLKFAPPQRDNVCDKCGGQLDQRADDRLDVISARIAEYNSKTEPLVSYYGASKLLADVSGDGHPDEVEERIESALRPFR